MPTENWPMRSARAIRAVRKRPPSTTRTREHSIAGSIARLDRTPMTTQSVATYIRGQIQPGIDAVGGFYRTCVLTGKALFRRPFHWREMIEQGWFIAQRLDSCRPLRSRFR